jgi:hypothetical protein
MLRFSRERFAALEEALAADTRTRVAAQVAVTHPGLAEDAEAISTLVAQLFDAGFTAEPNLFEAADTLVRIAMRADAKAAEARAIADAILFAGAHAPDARLGFLRAQDLVAAPDDA